MVVEPPRLKYMLVKLDHFPRVEDKKVQLKPTARMALIVILHISWHMFHGFFLKENHNPKKTCIFFQPEMSGDDIGFLKIKTLNS